MFQSPTPTLSERIADANAVTVALPSQFLARDVFLGASREGRKWRIGAVDRVGNRYPVTFGGVIDATLYLSRRQAFEALNARGLKVGAKVWALPEVRS